MHVPVRKERSVHVEVRNACASEEICACKSQCLAVEGGRFVHLIAVTRCDGRQGQVDWRTCCSSTSSVAQRFFGGTPNNAASLQMEKSSNNNCLSEPGACKQLEAGFFGVIAAELQEDLWTLGVGNLKWQTLEESLGYIQIVARLHANQRESTSFWWVQTLPLCAKHRCWIWKMTIASGNRFYSCLNVVQTNKMLLRFVFYAKGYPRCSRWATFEWKIFKGGGKTLVKNLRNWFLHGCFFGSDRSSINSKRQCRRIAGPLKTRCNPWRWKSCNLYALCDVVALGMIKGNKWNHKDAVFWAKTLGSSETVFGLVY